MSLPTQDQMLIEQRVANESKSVFGAYVLWFFVGFLGVHRFYLGDPKWGAIILGCVVGGSVATAAGFVPGTLVVGFGLLLVLIDLFLIPGLVGQQKREMRDELTRTAERRANGSPF